MSMNSDWSKVFGFKVLNIEQMNKLTTPRLLHYLNTHRHRLLQISIWSSNSDKGQFARQHMQDIKDILNTRPHVDK